MRRTKAVKKDYCVCISHCCLIIFSYIYFIGATAKWGFVDVDVYIPLKNSIFSIFSKENIFSLVKHAFSFLPDTIKKKQKTCKQVVAMVVAVNPN